jgi:hypothetical protein
MPMPAYRVEVTGTWRDLALHTEETSTHVFVVSAPGPDAATTAGLQLFGGEAARRRCAPGPSPVARVLLDGE